MKNNLSWRHHYIPIFYLKGFTNCNGKFYIFDKKKNKIINKSQSPKSFFFERNRHTLLNLNNDLDDFIETKLYKSFDNYTSKAFIELRKVNLSEFNDNLDKLSKIVMFINGIIYRIPKYDSYHIKKIKQADNKYLLPVYNKNHQDISIEFHNMRKENELYRYACRFYCSVKQSIPTPDEAKNWLIYQLPDDYKNKYFLITGDSPVLINDIELFGTSNEIIIAPLNISHFIVRSKMKLSEELNTLELLHLINLNVIKSSLNYICSPSKSFLERYIAESSKYKENVMSIALFNLFKNKTVHNKVYIP